MIEVWRCKHCKSDYMVSDNFNPVPYQCVVCLSIDSLFKSGEIPELPERQVEIKADASTFETEMEIGRRRKRLVIRLLLLVLALVLILCSMFFTVRGSVLVLVLVSICLLMLEGFLDLRWRKRNV